MAAILPLHIRLPQRAEAVSGQEQQPGADAPAKAAVDPRTASQDPSLKAKPTTIED